MSRDTAAAATDSATSAQFDMHLILQSSPTKGLTAVIRSEPFGAANPVDYGAFVIFSMLTRYIPLKRAVIKQSEAGNPTEEIISPGLKWTSGAFINTMNYDVLTNIFSYLLGGIASRLFLPVMAPEQFPTSDQERLEQLAIPIRRLESRAHISSNLAQNYQRHFEIACLLDAALNADHAAVERILEDKNGKDITAIKAMLSASGTAVIAHLGIERSGTALQMAFYSHDEAMFKFLADKMDSAEVGRQCNEIFDQYGVHDYDGLMRKLEADANDLCSEIEEAFRQATDDDLMNAYNHHSFVGSISALQDVLNRFKEALAQYVETNLVHNPHILQCLVEIDDRLDLRDKIFEALPLSIQAIGSVQKLSSARWLQYYAQGLFFLNDAEAPRSSFLCRKLWWGDNSSRDIRLYLSDLGVRSCIGVQGYGIKCEFNDVIGGMRGGLNPIIKTLVEQKQQTWKTEALRAITKNVRYQTHCEQSMTDLITQVQASASKVEKRSTVVDELQKSLHDIKDQTNGTSSERLFSMLKEVAKTHNAIRKSHGGCPSVFGKGSTTANKLETAIYDAANTMGIRSFVRRDDNYQLIVNEVPQLSAIIQARRI